MKYKLRGLSAEQWARKSLAVSLNLKNLLTELNAFNNENCIGLYAPFQKEPDWTLSFENSSGVNSFIQDHFAFPSLRKEKQVEEMVFIKSHLSNLILKKDFGVEILGPQDTREEEDICHPNVFLIPGMAFGRNGERLGRGKGYYDRYLGLNFGIKIGVCFSEQLDHRLPMDEYDIRMNFVVTDNEMIKIEV